tara:strand:- start:236 stop:1333 length:1098 start_codon:yes stop_codon:yes gene_type:complete
MAMKLGFWTGQREAQVERIQNTQIQEKLDAEEKRYQEGRTDRAAEIKASEFNQFKRDLIPGLIEKVGESSAARNKITAEIKTLENLKLRPDIARALVKSGQAGMVIKTAEKDNGYLRIAYLNQITGAVEDAFPAANAEERLRIIMDGYDSLGDDMSDGNQVASILSSVYPVKTNEELMEIVGGLDIVVPNFAGTADAININFAEGKPLAQGTITSIGRETKNRMATILGAGVKFIPEVGTSGSLEYTSTDFGQNQAAEIVGKVTEVVTRIQQTSPDFYGNQNTVFNKVEEMVQNGYAGINILQFLDNGIKVNPNTGEIYFADLTGERAALPKQNPYGKRAGKVRIPISGFNIAEDELDDLINPPT